MTETGKKMLASANAISYGVGGRVAAWLRQAYPADAAKLIARDFGSDERTAKGWLSGNRPLNRHWDAMVARWGKAFLMFCYQPHFDWAEQERLDAELAALQSIAARLQEEKKRHASDANAGGPVRAMADAAADQGGAMVADDDRPLRTAERR
jgi:hypothetical protein